MYNQKGQTLIETVIGIFILVMGISAAVSLANFSLRSTSNVTNQLVATGLAREAIEAVRNMRDTNWLQGTISNSCYNYESPSSKNGFCYPPEVWMGFGNANPFYDLDPAGNSVSFTLDMNPNANDAAKYWDLKKITGSPGTKYWLYYNSDAAPGTFFNTNPVGGGVASPFRREILIQQQDNNSTPASERPSYYQASIGPRLKVTSRVWWVGGRGCPVTANTWAESAVACRVQLVSYLTNWRNY